MKVLLVSNGFPPGGQWGTEYYTYELATGLVARGDEVRVLHPERETERPRFEVRRRVRYGVEVLELANAGDPRKRFRDSYRNERIEAIFEELLAEERPDVVHFTHLGWGLSVRLPIVARRAGVRTVVTLTDFGLLCHRGQLFDWRLAECAGPTSAERCARCVREPGTWDANALGFAWRRLAVRGAAVLGGLGRVVVAADIRARQECVREAMDAVDHWILPTRALGGAFLERGLDPARVTVLPYGLDQREYLRPRVERNGCGTRFVYMSQYMPHKGLACLLDAVRILQSRLPESVEPWSVDLYGNGCRGRYQRYAELLVGSRLPRRVTDRGPFKPLTAPEVLARTDCILVPSEWCENAPLTVLQARAAGVPVIASDVPGVTEVLDHGVHGWTFPRGDARGFAEAMSRVILRQVPATSPAPLVLLDDHLDAVQAIHVARPLVEAEPAAADSARPALPAAAAASAPAVQPA